MTIHGSSIDDASKGYITIHSLDPQDAPIADAMRAMVSSNKGAQPGASVSPPAVLDL